MAHCAQPREVHHTSSNLHPQKTCLNQHKKIRGSNKQD